MHRKHTTTACQICRDNKTKCDGARPVCGSCLRKGRVCAYVEGNDKRKISLRTAVNVLLQRVKQLTNTCNTAGIALPGLTEKEQSVIDEVNALYGSLSDEDVPSAVNTQKETTARNIESATDQTLGTSQETSDAIVLQEGIPVQYHNTLGISHDVSSSFDFQSWNEFSGFEPWNESPSDWPWHILAADIDGVTCAPLVIDQPIVSTSQQQSLENDLSADNPDSGTTSSDEGEADLIPKLAARLGSLRVAADGRLHYYGTASNLHFLGSSSTFEGDFDIRDMQREACIALENAKLDQEVPSDLENHLIDEFFKWCNPCYLVISRALFEKDRSQDSGAQGVYCSPALLAAICSITAAFEGRYHRTFITFPKPLAEFFADKSKVLLEFEIDRPCVSTLQTLLLLCNHEAAAGRDARMWLYGGMAMRLSFDLGLHVDSDPYVQQGILTADEAEVRRNTFWSCVVINHLWSFSLGRPFRIDSEEITARKPTGTSSVCLVTQHWALLCEDLAPLIRVLYGCARISKLSLQNLCFETSKRLLNWPSRIPDAIKVDENAVVPHEVLLLHMAYHNFCILVHRPWTSKSSQPQGQIGPGSRHARIVCRKSASTIASLLRIHEVHYGFRRMQVYAATIIFSASLILICGLIAEDLLGDDQNKDEKANVMGDLNTCFRALDEMSQSYECAKRSRHHLLEIQRHWAGRKKEAKLGARRNSQRQITGQDTSRKRMKAS